MRRKSVEGEPGSGEEIDPAVRAYFERWLRERNPGWSEKSVKSIADFKLQRESTRQWAEMTLGWYEETKEHDPDIDDWWWKVGLNPPWSQTEEGRETIRELKEELKKMLRGWSG